MINSEEVKKLFPIFTNIPNLVFLDNASTTQKPQQVIDKLVEVYTHYNSNVHRGLYPIADKVNAEYENARELIAKFINADKDEIIFTSGTTDATNFIAESLLRSKIISKNSNVLTTEMEHHANFLPWQRVTEGNLDYTKYTSDRISFDNQKIYDVVVYSIVSNVTGRFTDIKTLKKDNLKDAIFIADAAQAIAHNKIDVKEMDVDFLVFSGHKMFGPTGIGVIYAKKSWLEKLEPFRVGGGMINQVTKQNATWAQIPEKFEAGTPAIADAIALGEASRFIQEIGIENIFQHEKSISEYCLTKLNSIAGVKIYHDSDQKAGPVISFTIDKIHPHDVAQFLGDTNICVRAGHHCTQILHREVFEIPASVRVSFSIYNTNKEVDIFIEALNKCIEFYRH